MLLTVVVTYAVASYQYYSRRPTIARNYAAELNREAEATPVDQRAWPRYRAAKLRLEVPQEELDGKPWPWKNLRPGHAAWPDAVALAERNAPVYAEIREAATLRALGFILTATLDPALDSNAGSFPPDALPPVPALSGNPPLLNTLMPYLGAARVFTRHLALDAVIAAERGDAETVVANVRTMLHLAVQSRPGSAITQLVAIVIAEWAAEITGDVLHRHAGLLTDKQLSTLDALFAEQALGGRITLDTTGERMFFDDMLQRIYSDDGKGDGHITSAGVKELWRMGSGGTPGLAYRIVAPLSVNTFGTRRECAEFYELVMGRFESAIAEPFWKFDDTGFEQFQDEIEADDTLRGGLKMVQTLVPMLTQPYAASERCTQVVNAIRTTVALERHRLRTGAYPPTLSVLPADLLAAVPFDRYTGEPLQYRLGLDGPMLYSVGVDRDDDRGTPPLGARAGRDSPASNFWTRARVQQRLAEPGGAELYDGDWVLWPLPAPRDPSTPDDGPD